MKALLFFLGSLPVLAQAPAQQPRRLHPLQRQHRPRHRRRLRPPARATPLHPCHPPNPCSPVGSTWATSGTPASAAATIRIAASSTFTRVPSCWARTSPSPIRNTAGSTPFRCAPPPGAPNPPSPCTSKRRSPASTISTPIIATSPTSTSCLPSPIRCSAKASC